MTAQGMLAGIIISVAATGFSSIAGAVVDEYVFEPVQAEVKTGSDIVVAVHLKHKGTGQSVSDAVIFARRMDMAPDGMPTMTAVLEPLPATKPGIYRFKTNLAMEGNWQLSLAAKLQGENGTLQKRLVLKATD